MLTIVIDCANGVRAIKTLDYGPRHLSRAVSRARTLLQWVRDDEPLQAAIYLGGYEDTANYSAPHVPLVAVVYPVEGE